jgi:tetratricopeptide (TPR) repeat protein
MVEQGNTVSAMQLLSYLVVAPAATDLGPMISALMLRAMIDSNSVLLSYLGGVEALGLCSELLLMCDTNLSAAAATAGAKLTDAEICSRINRVQAEILFNPCSENVMVMLESLNNSAAHLLGAISSSDLNSSIQRTSLLRYVSASSAESLCMFELSEGDVDKATAALRGRLSAVLSTLPSDPSSVAALMWARMTYFSNLGCLYFSGGRMFAAAEYSGKALEVCDKLLNSENRDALKKLRLVLPVVELLSNAGVAYLRTGRSVAARECFERLSHLRPREPVVWLRLAECMISTAFMTYSPGSKLAFSMKCVAGGTFTLLK